jgi:hypothetical protein
MTTTEKTRMRTTRMSETRMLIAEVDRLIHENSELRHLLKEQLKISGKCCYAKAPAYYEIRQKLIDIGYGPQIINDILGEDLE